MASQRIPHAGGFGKDPSFKQTATLDKLETVGWLHDDLEKLWAALAAITAARWDVGGRHGRIEFAQLQDLISIIEEWLAEKYLLDDNWAGRWKMIELDLRTNWLPAQKGGEDAQAD